MSQKLKIFGNSKKSKTFSSNKKGLITFNIANFIPKIFFIVIVLISVVFVTNSFASYEIRTSAAEAYVFIERVIYSPNAITFSDVRDYPGIVDLDKFTAENLNKSIYNPENKNLAANLTLVGLDNKAIKSIIFNEHSYALLFIEKGIEGGSKEFKSSVYVLIKDNKKLIPANLKIAVYVK